MYKKGGPRVTAWMNPPTNFSQFFSFNFPFSPTPMKSNHTLDFAYNYKDHPYTNGDGVVYSDLI